MDEYIWVELTDGAEAAWLGADGLAHVLPVPNGKDVTDDQPVLIRDVTDHIPGPVREHGGEPFTGPEPPGVWCGYVGPNSGRGTLVLITSPPCAYEAGVNPPGSRGAPARVYAPLPPDRRALAETVSAWLGYESRRFARVINGRFGEGTAYQEAWLLGVKAAAAFDPADPAYKDIPFGAYARKAVRRHLTALSRATIKRDRVWRSLPDLTGADGGRDPLDQPDTRRGAGDPLWAAWFDEAAVTARAVIPLRQRVVLALRYVWCLRLRECVPLLGVSRERVRQIESSGIRRLEKARREVTTPRATEPVAELVPVTPRRKGKKAVTYKMPDPIRLPPAK